jgi:hypothetical protein
MSDERPVATKQGVREPSAQRSWGVDRSMVRASDEVERDARRRQSNVDDGSSAPRC